MESLSIGGPDFDVVFGGFEPTFGVDRQPIDAVIQLKDRAHE